MTDDELRKHIDIAKAATPGPWNAFIGLEDDCAVFEGAPGERIYKIAGDMESMRDALYIAANSPEVVIALCEEILRLRNREHGHTCACLECSLIRGAEP